MALRTFEDADGVEWQVWDTVPAKLVTTTLEGGWITFESAVGKRRLAPIPPYWVSAGAEELNRLLRKAKPVTDRSAERRAKDKGPSPRR